MHSVESFGGDWTREKLDVLEKYLKAYLIIFTRNPKAQFFRTVYVDAFAGAGYIRRPEIETTQINLFDDFAAEDAQGFIKGSAVRALELDPGFAQYLFLERDPDRFRNLSTLRAKYPGKKIEIENVEANKFLSAWCAKTDWAKTRAVVFLDPYGMQVEWSLLEEIAKTKAIDLWLLFPLGAAVMRLLQKKQPPPQSWAERMTAILGTYEWRTAFYRSQIRQTLFEAQELEEREASYESVANYFLERLKSIFAKVAGNPYVLKNSKNCPLYLFCFAAGNPKGAATAVKIAQDIMKS